jgi:hypothetical protein
MNATAAPTVPWKDPDTLSAVRPAVANILRSSSAFGKLPEEERNRIANQMVKVASYMANPDGLAKQELSSPEGGVLKKTPNARAQANGDVIARPFVGEQEASGLIKGGQRFAGKDFEAGAVKQGVEQFKNLVQAVDFPKFVSGLIKGVFQAIVESSIEQMKAYGELLANVAKTVDQFAQDNISQNNARDWLTERFPGKLGLDTSTMSSGFAEGDTPAPQARLVVTGDDADAIAKEISTELQLEKPIADISDENEEQRLVLAARLQMARGRQQLLASMVMLGINRIVVTDGLIHAKVVFDMRASDTAARQASASMFDRRSEYARTSTKASYGGWMTPVKASFSAEAGTDHVATVRSSVEDTSESKAEVKAKLSGEVRVNFKSDYFPMEKLANPQMISAIQGNAQPPEKPVPNA